MERQCSDQLRVRVDFGHHGLPRGDLPEAEISPKGAGRDTRTAGVPGYCVYGGPVALELMDDHASRRIPDLDREVVGAGCNHGPVRAHGKAHYFAGMPPEGADADIRLPSEIPPFPAALRLGDA